MKKLSLALGALGMAVCAICSVGCGNNDGDNADHTHKYEKYVCTVCGEYADNAPLTGGLLFNEKNENGQSVYAVSGIGAATDKDIYIPKTHNGKLVTSIAEMAFGRCENVTSIVIPNSVTVIAEGAFYGCENLSSIVIPNSVMTIEEGAFEGCGDIVQYEENELVYVDKWVIRCPDYVTSVELRDDTVGIADCVFDCHTDLTSIVIPAGVRSIGAYALSGCSSLANITYNGSNAQWAAIVKGKNWDLGIGDYSLVCNEKTEQ